MTQNARKLLLCHLKNPDQGMYAEYDAHLSSAEAVEAYQELMAEGLVAISPTGVARVGETTRPMYRLTDKGFAAAKSGISN